MAAPDAVEKKIRRKLARNVRALRDRKRWTFEETAHRADLHWRHLQKVEAGEVNATIRTLVRLARAFGVDADELLR